MLWLTINTRLKSSPRFALLMLAVLAFGTGVAQEGVEREGYFEVRSASTEELATGVHALDARLQLVLSSEALAALESGVTLSIEMQVQVMRVKRFFLDSVDAELAALAILLNALQTVEHDQTLPLLQHKSHLRE